jgi:GH25 family lysozyme M1 (1,4-beta-N-acetylmuramidase)
MATIKGIDISKWQGKIDYSKVKKSTNFVIIKATEGFGYTDPKFKANQKGFRSVKMPLGYYHYARPDLGNSPEKEADWFIKTIGKLEKGEVLALDYEVSYKDPVNWCKGFLDRVKEKTGVKPLLYINLSTNNKYNWSKVVKGDYGLWLALWDGSLTKRPKTDWKFIAMKQYGADTKVSGISGDVDGDVFFGDVKTFKKYGYQGGQVEENPTPDIASLKEEILELEKGMETLGKEKDALELKLEACGKEKALLQDKLEVANENIGQLEKELKIVREDIRGYEEELDVQEEKHTILQREHLRIVEEKNEAVRKYNELKKSKWMWVVEFLEKVFPARESKKN